MARSRQSRRPGVPFVQTAAFKVLLFIAAASLFGGFGYLLSLTGPQDINPSDYVSVPDELEVELAEKREQAKALEEAFEAATSGRSARPEDLSGLETALMLRQEVVDAVQAPPIEDQSALMQARTRYHEVAGAFLREESEREETLGREALADGFMEEAIRRLRRAANLQEKINKEYPLASTTSTQRKIAIEDLILEQDVKPLYEISVANERTAMAALESGDFNQAMLELRRAIALQEQINKEYKTSQYVSFQRVRNLQQEMASLKSSRMLLEVQQILDRGKQADAEQRYEDAGTAYTEALRLQRELNDAFPESRFASQERLGEIERLRQTVLSRPLAKSIIAADGQITELLAERNTREVVVPILETYEDIDRLRETFPLSSLYDETLFLKYGYLNFARTDLGRIQTALYNRLQPLDRDGGFLMLRHEVHQILYSQVMATNPSRNRGDMLPVDSVTWEEASEFAQRVAWVLGRPVSLPTETQVRRAMGDLRYRTFPDFVWSAENSDGASQPIEMREPGPNGFFDLLGNLSEWIDAPATADNANTIGGSFVDPLEDIIDVPVIRRSKTERNRSIGFRIIVSIQDLD